MAATCEAHGGEGNVDFVDLQGDAAIGRGGGRKESGLGVSDLGVE